MDVPNARECGRELIFEQREVRTCENNRVDLVPSRRREHRLRGERYLLEVHAFASKLSFSEFDEFG